MNVRLSASVSPDPKCLGPESGLQVFHQSCRGHVVGMAPEKSRESLEFVHKSQLIRVRHFLITLGRVRGEKQPFSIYHASLLLKRDLPRAAARIFRVEEAALLFHEISDEFSGPG